METNRILDSIIIGAGHAGISTSYYLKKQNITHVVLEKGRVGESWRSLRWDSFALNTPNWMNCLPEDAPPKHKAHNFYTKQEYINYLQNYLDKNELPVLENSKVVRVIKDDYDNLFSVTFEFNKINHTILTKTIVVASGILNVPKTSNLNRKIDGRIHQIHASEYRNANKLPKGNVLVVGGGQSGAQITEDLLDSGRKVYLSSSKVGRVPRRYRGKDFTEWFELINHFSEKLDNLEDKSTITDTNPLMSGVGPLGHSISLQLLSKKGATILGRLKTAHQHILHFENNAKENITYADDFYKKTIKFIEKIIEEKGVQVENLQDDLVDNTEDFKSIAVSSITALDLTKENITSIIWATGFTGNFKYLKLPVLDKKGMPIHDKGNSSIPGLVFFGFPWLTSRKSGIVYGMNDEAKTTVDTIIEFLTQHSVRRPILKYQALSL